MFKKSAPKNLPTFNTERVTNFPNPVAHSRQQYDGRCQLPNPNSSLVHNLVSDMALLYFTGKIKIQDILACSFLDDLLEVPPTFLFKICALHCN